MSLSVYLHFPFCTNRCSYCDFYKELYSASLEKEFFSALRKETDLAATTMGDSYRKLTSIFIGGGTPSLATIDLLSDWLNLLRKHFEFDDDLEFSFESNPESINLENLKALKKLGVNRPIFGIQSFNPKLLKILDREHDPHHSQRAIYFANALGYDNFGVDLLFGLPSQNSRMMSDDIDQMIDLDPPHISFYQLAVEEGTPLAARVEEGGLRMPDNELGMAMYKGGVHRLTEAGYVRYEVSSFARPGFECRHNLGYWQGNEYLGLGPSAHSFIGGERLMNVSNLSAYIESLKQGKLPRVVDDSGPDERMTEAIMLGLRTAVGVSRDRFSQRFGMPVETRFDSKQYEMLVKSGHLIPDKRSLRLSDEGILLVDEITRRLLK